MKTTGWPWISFSEVLRPEPGWEVDHAVLTTYSTDLIVLVTALISLSGCNLDQRNKGSRLELVRAMDQLRGRVRVLAQSGRVSLPAVPRSILGLLDEFLFEIKANEVFQSWHLKSALVKYHLVGNPHETQWRLWIGSRNLTASMNWEAGLVVSSRADNRGDKIAGLASFGRYLFGQAHLNGLDGTQVEQELHQLTWDCPPGASVRAIRLLGPELDRGLPSGVDNAGEVYLVSPFLDRDTVRTVSKWGAKDAKRTILSTRAALNTLAAGDALVLANGFENVLECDAPDLSAVGCDPLVDLPPSQVETADGEDLPITGLHAKMLFASRGKDRRLWLGSANATSRAWGGRNYEVVAELGLGQEIADSLIAFIKDGKAFKMANEQSEIDQDDVDLEKARNIFTGMWDPKQRVVDGATEVYCEEVPLLTDRSITLEIAPLNYPWIKWPAGEKRAPIGNIPLAQRTNFIQVRLVRGDRMCAWIQVAAFEPGLDETRNRAAISQYLTPQTFLLWLRSLLAQEAPQGSSEAWDSLPPTPASWGARAAGGVGEDEILTVEEILRAWARDSTSFVAADNKMKAYLGGLRQTSIEAGRLEEAKHLGEFEETWNTLASELLPRIK